MQQEIANPNAPRDKPPPDVDGKLMWLIRRHNGGRDNGCDWCLVVDEINRLQLAVDQMGALKALAGITKR